MLLRVGLIALIVPVGVWCGLALWFRGPARRGARAALVIAWGLAGLTAALTIGAGTSPAPAAAVFAALATGVAGWWLSIRPSQHRDWAPDVARLLTVETAGDTAVLHNVRHFEWRTPTDYTPRWEARRYDLRTLESADLVVSYWMGPAIAHTLVSFGFEDGRRLVFSVEVRRTRDQAFSALGGFFKQSERVLVAADERDIVRTRSNVRGEDVYLYRVGIDRAALRALFEAYLREAERLHDTPRFYHTLVSNCTTLVFDMVRVIVPGLPRDWRLLLSGYLPQYLYDLGALDTSRAFAELRRRGHINPRALAWDRDPQTDFSRAIRRGVPRPDGRLSEAPALATQSPTGA